MAGKRGPLPNVVPITVDGIDPPAGMLGEALAFFRRNAHVVRAAEDFDTFCLLCRIWADIQVTEGREKGDHVRAFTQLARQFGMTPDSRRKLQSTADRHDEKTGFNF